MKWLLFSAFAFCAVMLSAQDITVDKSKINGAQGDVAFENNTAAPAVVNSLSQIRGIGAELARLMIDEQGNIRRGIWLGSRSRYSMIQNMDKKESNGAPIEEGADIIELGEQAGVDRIGNLRQIIAGYLETLYKYSKDEADELAFCITVYNAVYRGNFDFIETSYDKSITSKLNPKKAGLSARWEEWAGNSQIIIPIKIIGYTPEIAIEKIMTPEVKEIVKKESAIDTDKLVREQKAREAAEEAERRELERRKTEEENAKIMAKRKRDEAAERVANLQRALDSAIEKEKMMYARLEKLKEQEDELRANVENARKDIVVNKFGKPIAGNDTAKAKERELKEHQSFIKNQEKGISATQKEIEDLRKSLEEAKLVAAGG